jgi:hypothetical protein
VRGFLLSNLRASGLKRKSGQLETAVGQAKVWIWRKGNRAPRLMIGFKPGMDKKVYVYGTALSFGAVRRAGALGEKARRSLKKTVLNQTIGTGAAAYLKKKGMLRFQTGEGRRVIHTGTGQRIRKPWDFFKLTPTQAQTIAQFYERFLGQRLETLRKTAIAA